MWRTVRRSEKAAAVSVKERRDKEAAERRAREDEDSQRRRRLTRTWEEEKEGEEAGEVRGGGKGGGGGEEDGGLDDVADLSHIPSGFYHAKQFDFVHTVRGQAEKQRRARRLAQSQRGSHSSQPDTDPPAPRVLARGRKTDWQVDEWWEAKRLDSSTGTPSSDFLPPSDASPHRPPSASLVSSSPLLLEDAGAVYASVTPLYLSSRADYRAFLPTVPHHLALNALLRPPASRSILERQLLDRWVRLLPLYGQVEGGEGGKELLGVSQVVRRAAGEAVYEEGEIGACMYVLLEGEVRLEREEDAAVTPASTPPPAVRPTTAPVAAHRHTTTRPTTAAGMRGAPAAAHVPSAVAMQKVVTLLHPYALFGLRRAETLGTSSSPATSAGRPATTAGLRGWPRVRAVLHFQRVFQMKDIGRLAESRVRQESARCTEESVLLAVSYTDYDGVSRAHRDRQSRLTLGSFRAMEGVGRLRMRGLSRLGKAVVYRRVERGEWVVVPGAAPASALWLLTAGTVAAVRGVELLSYHRTPTSTRDWEWREVRGRRAVRVRVDTAPAVLGGEALLGVRGYDCGWRAETVCEVYALQRRDFHLLMGPQVLDGWETRVQRARDDMKRAVAAKLEEDERAQAEQAGKKRVRRVKVRVLLHPCDEEAPSAERLLALTQSKLRSRSITAVDDTAPGPSLYEEVRGVIDLSAFLP